MKKLLHKKLNKKGFTLAELLIVIAIIAVLVAIAIPIFTSQLQSAKIARDEANIRSVKAAAITQILSGDSGIVIDEDTTTWYAEATVDANGEITSIRVSDTGSFTISEPGDIDYPGTIGVEINAVDFSASATPG